MLCNTWLASDREMMRQLSQSSIVEAITPTALPLKMWHPSHYLCISASDDSITFASTAGL